MGEMEPGDYQLVRIGLLAAISDRAAELGEEIATEAADTIDDLRAERDRLRGEVAALRGLLSDANQSLKYVRSWSKTLPDCPPIFEDFWTWAEGWDCHLELLIDDALAAVPADARGEDAPPAGREGGE